MTTKPERYTFTNGWTMQRESASPFHWILRDKADECVDRDRYRHDVIERHRLEVATHYDPTWEAIHNDA